MTEMPYVKIRVEANTGKAARLSEFISTALEHFGFDVIERTPPYPLREEPNRERSYLTAIPSQANLGDKNAA